VETWDKPFSSKHKTLFEEQNIR
jgi:hypothetical protein